MLKGVYNKLKVLSPGKLVIVSCILSVVMNIVLGMMCKLVPIGCGLLTTIVALVNVMVCAIILIRLFECGDKRVNILK